MYGTEFENKSLFFPVMSFITVHVHPGFKLWKSFHIHVQLARQCRKNVFKTILAVFSLFVLEHIDTCTVRLDLQ